MISFTAYCFLVSLKIDLLIGAEVSLSQYSIVENINLLPANITLSRRTSEDVLVEVTISDGSANGNVE